MSFNFSSGKRATWLCLLVMFFWGSLFPMIKIGYKAFEIAAGSPGSILLFAGVRFFICGIVLIAVTSALEKKPCLPAKSDFSAILPAALFAYALHYTCTYIGVAHLESSKTAIIKQIGTLFIVCFAFLFRKEDRFSVRKLVGGILGFASIIAININGKRVSLNAYDLLVLGASACSVISTILLKNAYDKLSPMAVTAWAQLIGGAALGIVGLCLGGTIEKVDFNAILVLMYICFASSMGYALWNVLLKYNNMSKLNLIKFTEALFSALCSWALLGENIFTVKYLMAFVLVCLGLLIGNGVLKFGRKAKNG